MGYLPVENSVDSKNNYFLFGKREARLTKGLFVGSNYHGSFFIEYGYNKSYLRLDRFGANDFEEYVITDDYHY
jgi:hypothetical protein